MRIPWENLCQQALVSGWLYVVSGAVEGLGATPADAVDDAYQRARDEYEAALYRAGAAEDAPAADNEVDPAARWFQHLEGGNFVHLTAGSVEAIAQAVLGWVDPNEVDRLSWIESLTDWANDLKKSVSQPLFPSQEA